MRPKLVNPICFACGSVTTYVRKKWHNAETWYYNVDVDGNIIHVLCMKCYSRHIKDPEQSPRRQYKNGKRTLLKENPRKGVCSKCGAVKGKDCVFTTIHNGIELCPRCKGKMDYVDGRLKSIGGWHKGRKHSPEHRKSISKALMGRPGYRKGLNNSEESKEKMRQFRMTQVFPQKDSSIERAVQSALTNNNIDFIRHKPFRVGKRMHQVDIFIEPNICVECDGEYWHGTKEQMRFDSIINNELTRIGNTVIRLSESDIINDLNSCINKIKKTLKNG